MNDRNSVLRAEQLAADAIDALQVDGMFQGYPDSGVYESVDGVGVLFLAMLNLEWPSEVERWGLRF